MGEQHWNFLFEMALSAFLHNHLGSPGHRPLQPREDRTVSRQGSDGPALCLSQEPCLQPLSGCGWPLLGHSFPYRWREVCPWRKVEKVQVATPTSSLRSAKTSLSSHSAKALSNITHLAVSSALGCWLTPISSH